jgi:hypothetical protein
MARGTRTFSARWDTDVLDRLKRRSELAGTNKSRLAERYVDEGTRMDEHPGIVFRGGPTGRRAASAPFPTRSTGGSPSTPKTPMRPRRPGSADRPPWREAALDVLLRRPDMGRGFLIWLQKAGNQPLP